MNKFKELKQKLDDNKYKIIMGAISIAGVYIIAKQYGDNKTYQTIIRNQNDRMNDMQLKINDQQKDIDILKHVMNGTVLNSLKESTKRQLRYAEGRLNNALKNDNVISEVDIKLREGEIEYFSKELEKIFEAEKLLTKGD